MLYYALVSIFSLAFMFANILGGTIFPFPFSKPLFLTSGTLVYPITFVISHLVRELYGEKRARIMVCSGFAVSLCAFSYQYLTQDLSQDLSQDLAQVNFRISAILIVSSLIGFASSQLLDIRSFNLVKKRTRTHYPWLRNQVSTYFSQFIDTLLVNLMIFIVATLPLLYPPVKLTKEKVL